MNSCGRSAATTVHGSSDAGVITATSGITRPLITGQIALGLMLVAGVIRVITLAVRLRREGTNTRSP